MTNNVPRADQYDASRPEDEAGLVQGKWVILAVVGMSVAAAMVSWVYYARLQERPLAFWGSRSAEMILRAPEAKAYRLSPVTAESTASPIAGAPAFTIAGERFTAVAERDVSHGNGFSHIRNSLIHDRSFAWEETSCEEPCRWEYVIVFVEGGESVSIALAFNCPRVIALDSDRTASILPVAKAIEAFLLEQFPPESGAADAK